MKLLAIIATRGSTNALASVCTMAMAAAVSDIPVRIFFRDEAVLKEVKSQGDVKLYACTSSMAIAGVTPADLIPEIDEPRGLTSFLLEEMSEADAVLTF